MNIRFLINFCFFIIYIWQLCLPCFRLYFLLLYLYIYIHTYTHLFAMQICFNFIHEFRIRVILLFLFPHFVYEFVFRQFINIFPFVNFRVLCSCILILHCVTSFWMWKISIVAMYCIISSEFNIMDLSILKLVLRYLQSCYLIPVYLVSYPFLHIIFLDTFF
jgi:hypothetical protein